MNILKAGVEGAFAGTGRDSECVIELLSHMVDVQFDVMRCQSTTLLPHANPSFAHSLTYFKNIIYIFEYLQTDRISSSDLRRRRF